MNWYDENMILMTMSGSHAYGLATPESDVDKKGIAFLNKNEFFKLGSLPEQYIKEANKGYIENSEPTDLTIYAFQKYFSLVLTSNPNIVEMLFNSDDNILFVSDIGKKLIQNRHLFLSKKVRWSFAGYSESQLKRIKGHRSYLLNPPTKKPERSDYQLPDMPLISKDQRRAFLKLISNLLIRKRDYFDAHIEFQKMYEKVDWNQEMNELRSDDFDEIKTLMSIDDNMMQILKQETKYERDMKHYTQYLNWKENRNPIRAKMEAESGFDRKHGSHLIRLQRMAVEMLKTGNLYTNRVEAGDADLLRAIKNGDYSYEQLIEQSDELKVEIDELYKNCDTLPKNIDIDKVNEFYAELIYDMYQIKI